MRSYEAARGSFNFVESLARFIIGVGFLAALGGGTLGSEMAGRAAPPWLIGGLCALPGLIIAMVGYYGLAMAQMGRASVDSAEYAQQALQVARDQLEVSRQALQQGKQLAASYAPQTLKKRPDDLSASESTAVETDASYGQRPNGEAISGQTANTPDTGPAALEHRPELPLDAASTTENPMLTESVTYKNGMWHVGDRKFQSETPARNYAAQLGVNPNAKVQSP